MAYRNARGNPILLRLGNKANWISNDFRKYDYNLEVLKNIQVYRYLNDKFSTEACVRKVFFFSHITMRNMHGKCLITMHFFHRQYNLRRRKPRFRRLGFKLSRMFQQRNRIYWLNLYRQRKFLNVKLNFFSKIFFVILKFVLPYIRYYHFIQFKKFTGEGKSQHLLLAKYITSVVRKYNLFVIFSKINKMNVKSLLGDDYYISLMISLKNYLLTVIDFVKLIDFIFSNKDKFKSVVYTKGAYHKRVALLLIKIKQQVNTRYVNKKKIRKLEAKKLLNRRVKCKLRKIQIKHNVKGHLFKIQSRFKAKLYRELQVPIFFYSRRLISKSSVNVYLYKYSKYFRYSLIMANLGLTIKNVDTTKYVILRRLKKKYKRKLYKLNSYRFQRDFCASKRFKRRRINILHKYKYNLPIKQLRTFRQKIKQRIARNLGKHVLRPKFKHKLIYKPTFKTQFKNSNRFKNRKKFNKFKKRKIVYPLTFKFSAIKGLRSKKKKYFSFAMGLRARMVRNIMRKNELVDRKSKKFLVDIYQKKLADRESKKHILDLLRFKRAKWPILQIARKKAQRTRNIINVWWQDRLNTRRWITFTKRLKNNKWNKQFNEKTDKPMIFRKFLSIHKVHVVNRVKNDKTIHMRKLLQRKFPRVPSSRLKKLGHKLNNSTRRVHTGRFFTGRRRALYGPRFYWRRKKDTYDFRGAYRKFKKYKPFFVRPPYQSYWDRPISRLVIPAKSYIIRPYKDFFKRLKLNLQVSKTIRHNEIKINLSKNNKSKIIKNFVYILKRKIVSLSKLVYKRKRALFKPIRFIPRKFILSKLKSVFIKMGFAKRFRYKDLVSLLKKRELKHIKKSQLNKHKKTVNQFISQFKRPIGKELFLQKSVQPSIKFKNIILLKKSAKVLKQFGKFDKRIKHLYTGLQFGSGFSENDQFPNFVMYDVKAVLYTLNQRVNFEIMSLRRKELYKKSALLLLNQFKEIVTLYEARHFFRKSRKFLKNSSYGKLASRITPDIEKILGAKAYFKVFSVRRNNYHPILILKWIILRLSNQYTLNEVLYPMLKELSKWRKDLKSFMVICAGRFTRRQRAMGKIVKLNNVGLHTFDEPVSYAFDKVRLRYGMCGLRFYMTTLKYFREKLIEKEVKDIIKYKSKIGAIDNYKDTDYKLIKEKVFIRGKFRVLRGRWVGLEPIRIFEESIFPLRDRYITGQFKINYDA